MLGIPSVNEWEDVVAADRPAPAYIHGPILKVCPGVRVTKAPFVNLSVSKIFYLRFFESQSYLAGVTTAELQQHLSNINVIFNIQCLFDNGENIRKQQNGGNWQVCVPVLYQPAMCDSQLEMGRTELFWVQLEQPVPNSRAALSTVDQWRNVTPSTLEQVMAWFCQAVSKSLSPRN